MSTHMKTLLLRALLLIVPSLAAFAQFTPITEDFSTTGPLVGSTPDSGLGDWTRSSGGTPALSTASGALGLAASAGESAQLNFASVNLGGGTIYMGWDFTVSADGSLNTSDSVQAIAGFRSGTPASGSFELSFGVFRPSAAAQTFSGVPSTTTSQVVAGLFTGTSLNASNTDLAEWAVVLNRGVAYRAVLGVDLDADEARLWINPVSVASSSVAVPFDAAVRGVFFRQGGASHGEVTIDNLSVSRDFAAAAAFPVSAVPEPSASALLLGLFATSAAFTRRRQRN